MTGFSVALGGGEVKIACATGETNIWLSPSAKQRRNPCSGSPPVYQDLSTRHDWPVKKDMLDLPIRMKGNSKRIFGDSLSPLEAQNKYLGAASQTLLTEVKLRLRRRLKSRGLLVAFFPVLVWLLPRFLAIDALVFFGRFCHQCLPNRS